MTAKELYQSSPKYYWMDFYEFAEAYASFKAAEAPGGEKRTIDRPCSACSAGDTKMEHHDHFPPFRAEAPGGGCLCATKWHFDCEDIWCKCPHHKRAPTAPSERADERALLIQGANLVLEDGCYYPDGDTRTAEEIVDVFLQARAGLSSQEGK